MQLDDMILVSVDDHVVEPPDMFERHLPARWRDVAPHVVHAATTAPTCGSTRATRSRTSGSTRSPAGRRTSTAWSRRRFDEIRSGCYDIDDRVRDMDANGVLGSMCFPSFPNLCGQLFSRVVRPGAGLAILQAYNDWHIDEWCGTYPGRFIPLMLPPIWDPEAMAAEVRRIAAKGCHAVSFSENPAKLKLPSFHDDALGPVLAGVRRTRARSCACTSARRRRWSSPRADAPIDVLITLQPMNIVQAAADLLWSPVLRKFPDLRVALSEGGIGWIPYFSTGSTGSTRATTRGPARTSAAGCRARCSASGSSRASSTTRPAS